MFPEMSQLMGPLGGTIALSWAAGAASGYYFGTKMMKDRLKYLENQIALSDKKCDERIQIITERYDGELQNYKDLIENLTNRVKLVEDSRFLAMKDLVREANNKNKDVTD